MVKTLEGVLNVMNAWIWGIANAGKQLGNLKLYFHLVESEGVKIYLKKRGLRLDPTDDPTNACRDYVEIFDKEGLLDKDDFEIKKENDTVHIKVGGKCPYRQACTWMKESNIPIQCGRAVPFCVAIELACDKDYRHELKIFGEECEILLKPGLRV
ncbi:MAG: hypothetical protein ACE5K4_10615 [Candidatus Hydrothermarchaeota archaeon]